MFIQCSCPKSWYFCFYNEDKHGHWRNGDYFIMNLAHGYRVELWVALGKVGYENGVQLPLKIFVFSFEVWCFKFVCINATFFFFCHPNDSPSFLVMEPNSALFFLHATCAYLKNCQGQQKDLPLKKVNSHHGPILKISMFAKSWINKWLTASPLVLSMWLQTLQFNVKKWNVLV